MGLGAHEVGDQFGHHPSEDDGGEADHDEHCALDDGDLVPVGLVFLDGEDEGQGYRAPDGARGSDDDEFVVGHLPAHAEFENGGESEDGCKPGDDADHDFCGDEGDGEDLVGEVEDDGESEVDEDDGLSEEGDELEADAGWGWSYVVACMPPGVKL